MMKEKIKAVDRWIQEVHKYEVWWAVLRERHVFHMVDKGGSNGKEINVPTHWKIENYPI